MARKTPGVSFRQLKMALWSGAACIGPQEKTSPHQARVVVGPSFGPPFRGVVISYSGIGLTELWFTLEND